MRQKISEIMALLENPAEILQEHLSQIAQAIWKFRTLVYGKFYAKKRNLDIYQEMSKSLEEIEKQFNESIEKFQAKKHLLSLKEKNDFLIRKNQLKKSYIKIKVNFERKKSKAQKL